MKLTFSRPDSFQRIEILRILAKVRESLVQRMAEGCTITIEHSAKFDPAELPDDLALAGHTFKLSVEAPEYVRDVGEIAAKERSED